MTMTSEDRAPKRTIDLVAFNDRWSKEREKKFAALDAYVERLTGGSPSPVAAAFEEVKQYRDQGSSHYSDPERVKKIARLVGFMCDGADPFHTGELLEDQTDVFTHIHTLIGLI